MPCPRVSIDDAFGHSGTAPVDGGAPTDALVGRLDPVLIQRVIRARYGRFQRCFEDGLARNPDLGGRVTVRLVIEADGGVSKVRVVCTSMPDRIVVKCVVAEYEELHFPKPEGGIVTVVYPIMFTPGD
jgi:hypothetical protein